MSMTPPFVHLAAASLNQTAGDWRGNRERIVAAMNTARARGARLLLLPELCLSGYNLGDRMMRRGTLERCWQSLMNLLDHSHGLVTTVGLPLLHRDTLYNATAVIANGRIWGLVAKEHLAVGDVQYENRWFSEWLPSRREIHETPDGQSIPLGRLVFDAHGIGRFGIEICEDGWKGLRPGSIYALAGARIVLNPSASWFVIGKQRRRRALVAQASREDHLIYLYSSLSGCDSTRLVFDGSVLMGVDGQIVAEGDRFRFGQDILLVDRVIATDALTQTRMEEGSWHSQVDAFEAGSFGASPKRVVIEGDFAATSPPPPPEPYWLDGTQPKQADPSLTWLAREGLIPHLPAPTELPYLELELALAMGLHEYSRKSGFNRFALALSGGRDSAMVALLVHRALHYAHPHLTPAERKQLVSERLTTAYLGTQHSSEATQQAANALASELGTNHCDASIQPAVHTHLDVVEALTGTSLSWNEPSHDIPLQNLQARIRGSIIWTIANLRGAVLLTTGNKSEAAVGYTTMDGDTCGGLAPIANVPKSLIDLWLRWAGDFYGYHSIDQVLATPATAELRPPDKSQTDETDLMPYAILDRLTYHFVQLGQEPRAMAEALWPSLKVEYQGNKQHFANHIRTFVRMFCSAQWKRERLATSFRATAFDLDPNSGFRFPVIQEPFTEELQDLDAWAEYAETA